MGRVGREVERGVSRVGRGGNQVVEPACGTALETEVALLRGGAVVSGVPP